MNELHGDGTPMGKLAQKLEEFSQQMDERWSSSIAMYADDLEDQGFSSQEIDELVSAYAKQLMVGREKALETVVQFLRREAYI